MKKKITVLALLIAIILSGIQLLADKQKEGFVNKSEDGLLTVSFLDVGQGDSTFIEFPDGKCMLIDASENEYAKTIIEYIEDKGYSRIDYVVATHPHSDHIGGMADVIEAFDIGKFYMPEKEHTSKTFENMLLAVSEKECNVGYLKAGDVIFEQNDVTAIAVAPCRDNYEELNDYSAVILIEYKDTAFLFTGDAEAISENDILNAGYDVKADVLKVGHHGSKTSSSSRFIKAVSPKVAIISCGEDNEYGFPKKTIVNRLEKVGAQVLVTYMEGTIVLVSDGEAVYREK